jgi:phage gpG-like protein
LSDAKEAANEQVATQLFGWVQRNIQAEGGLLEDGPWPPLAESTLAEKKRLGYSPKPLIRTGNLRQSFGMYYDENIAGVGARASYGVDYAEVHEYGGGNVPQRRMLPRFSEVREDILPIYRRAIEAHFGRSG